MVVALGGTEPNFWSVFTAASPVPVVAIADASSALERASGVARRRTSLWQIDRERYRASPLMSDGTVGQRLELPGLENFLIERQD